jgi:TetR/AcrR family transcriptional regulator, repressor for uid operon
MRKADPELRIRRRAEIVTAAEQCFLKRGFHQSSMQNIAAESGLSMGLLYRYFTNKEAIIEAAAQQDQEAALNAIRQMPDDGDIFAAWATLIIDMAREASAFEYATLASEIIAEAHRSPKLLKMLRSNDAALTQAIKDKLEAQHGASRIALLDDPERSAQALMILFDGLTIRQMTKQLRSPAIAFPLIEQLVSAILD